MNAEAIWYVIAIGLSYFILTFAMPAVFFYRYLKAKPFVVRIAVYQAVGNGYLLFWGFVLSFLNIWSRPLVFSLVIVLPLLAKLLIFRRDLIHLVLDYYQDKRAKVVTARGTLRSIRRWASHKLKEAYYRYIRYHYLEILILLALAVFAVWFYGYFKFHYMTYANSDEATHLFWLNALFGKDPFPVGMYPHSIHFMMAALHSICGLQTILINHYFSLIIMLMIHFMIYAAVKAFFRSAPAAVLAVGFFLLTDMFYPQRYHSTLPMEFGMIAMLVMIILLNEFMKTRTKLFMWIAALSMGLTFHAHGYVSIFIIFIWLAFILIYLKTIIRLKVMLRSLLIILLAFVIAVGPFGAGLLLGQKLEQSINWAMQTAGIEAEENAESLVKTQEKKVSDKETEEETENAGQKETGNTEEKETAAVQTEEQEAEQAQTEQIQEAPKELTPYQTEYLEAETPGDYLKATEHLLMGRMVNTESQALIFLLLLLAAFLYGIAKLIQSHLLFRKRKKELTEEGIPKKEVRKQKQEFLVRNGIVLVVPLMILFGTFCYAMGYIGLPALVHPHRASMILAPVAALLFAAPVAAVEELLCLIPIKQKRAITFSLLVLVGAGLSAYYAKGPVKQLDTIDLYPVTEEESNKLSYDLIAGHPRNSWTVISPVNDLLSIRYYGYHYEVIDLLLGIENGKKNIAMPTNELFVVIEKKVLPSAATCYLPDYHKELEEKSYPVEEDLVDMNYYDLGYANMHADAAYSTFRRITMSKLYYWMEEMKKDYPNEVELYSEDEFCAIYQIRQSADFPLNLAKDYRKENYGVNAKRDYEKRNAEENEAKN